MMEPYRPYDVRKEGHQQQQQPQPPQTPQPSAGSSRSADDSQSPPRKVYVENLTVPITEDSLRDMFKPFGAIDRIHIGTDKNTGKQLGFAFVEFFEDQSGLAAISAMHGHEVAGRMMRCSVAKKKSAAGGKPAAQQSSQPPMMMMIPMMGPNGMIMMPVPQQQQQTQNGSSLLGAPPPVEGGEPAPLGRNDANLFLSNIPSAWTEDDLMTTFVQFGPIISVKLLPGNQEGKHKGQGFVRFAQPTNAANAIAAWNGKSPPGSDLPLQVRVATVKGANQNTNTNQQQQPSMIPPQPMQPMMPPMMQMPMHGMPPYPGYPPPMDPALQFPQHYAHAQPQPPPDDSSYGPDRHGRSHARHNPMERPPPSASASAPGGGASSHIQSCLFVFHVPKTCNQSELQTLFEQYGSVVDCSMPTERGSGEHKGYAFINMRTREDAEKAIAALNGYCIGTKKLKVTFKQSGSSNASNGAQTQSHGQAHAQPPPPPPIHSHPSTIPPPPHMDPFAYLQSPHAYPHMMMAAPHGYTGWPPQGVPMMQQPAYPQPPPMQMPGGGGMPQMPPMPMTMPGGYPPPQMYGAPMQHGMPWPQ